MKKYQFLLMVVFCCQLGFSSTGNTPRFQLRSASKSRGTRYKLNAAMGTNVVKGVKVVSSFQFGKAPYSDRPFFIGPELSFSLLSSGSVLSILLGAWYEFHPFPSPRLGITIGGFAGPGFATQIPNFPTTPLVVFFDAALSQQLDEFVTLKGQLRPGVIGGQFAFITNLQLSFRFS